MKETIFSTASVEPELGGEPHPTIEGPSAILQASRGEGGRVEKRRQGGQSMNFLERK